jgi:hypothetical protein
MANSLPHLATLTGVWCGSQKRVLNDEAFRAEVEKAYAEKGREITLGPLKMGDKAVEPIEVYQQASHKTFLRVPILFFPQVCQYGGFSRVDDELRWGAVLSALGCVADSDNAKALRTFYVQHLQL